MSTRNTLVHKMEITVTSCEGLTGSPSIDDIQASQRLFKMMVEWMLQSGRRSLKENFENVTIAVVCRRVETKEVHWPASQPADLASLLLSSAYADERDSGWDWSKKTKTNP
jgi:hypothetical protein